MDRTTPKRHRLRTLAVAAMLVVSAFGSALPASAAPPTWNEHPGNVPEHVQETTPHGWTWVRGDVELDEGEELGNGASTTGWTWVR